MDNKTYQSELVKAMKILRNELNVVFIGQNLKSKGCPMYNSLLGLNANIIEVGVMEDTQMGMSIGMALNGDIPVSCFPRIDFLICAINQLVNHLDKVEQMSKGEFKPGVIIRTQIGNTKPLNPGPQHCGDYTMGIKKMVKYIKVVKLTKPEQIVKSYKEALKRAKMGQSTLLIERGSGVWQI